MAMRGRSQAHREEVLGEPRLTVAGHPLLDSLVTVLRDARTPAPAFGQVVAEATRFLVWEALRDEPVSEVTVPGHDGTPVRGAELAPGIAAVAILRAGLSMAAPLQQLTPSAPIYQIGVRRDEATLQPHVYYTNLPESFSRIRRLLLLDPMLATGGSAVAAVEAIRPHFAGPITFLGLIAAPLGVQRLLASDSEIRIHLAALDQRLNERGYILPGLGDAGDRFFGTTG